MNPVFGRSFHASAPDVVAGKKNYGFSHKRNILKNNCSSKKSFKIFLRNKCTVRWGNETKFYQLMEFYLANIVLYEGMITSFFAPPFKKLLFLINIMGSNADFRRIILIIDWFIHIVKCILPDKRLKCIFSSRKLQTKRHFSLFTIIIWYYAIFWTSNHFIVKEISAKSHIKWGTLDFISWS